MIAASTLPSNDGYVAAAYLVFLALVVIYVAIMASRLARVERELVELTSLEETPPEEDEEAPPPPAREEAGIVP